MTEAFRARARLAAELAGRAVEPRYVRWGRDNEALACELYRQAVYWTLLALGNGLEARRSLSEVWRAAGEQALVRAAGSVEAAQRLEQQLANASFSTFAESGFDDCSALRFKLQTFCSSLLDELEAPRRELRVLHLERWLRVGIIACVGAACVAAGLGIGMFQEQKQDLARGKAWRVSSSGFTGCRSPQQVCDSSPGFFFHTTEEKSPWVEIDLGSKTRVSAVRVLNRLDCCSERAAPLVIEVSVDQEHWVRVARRADAFKSWKAEFKPVTVRWVRARVEGSAILHLHQLRVLP